MKPTNPVTMGLFCPQCGAEGMRKEPYKADSGRSRWRCQSCQTRTTRPLNEAPQLLPEFKKDRVQRFIITSAVNDTPVVAKAFDTYKLIAKEYAAQLVVIATVYKNPDMTRQGFLETLTWPTEVIPYVCDREFTINKNLVVRGDYRIRTTAINPLAGANHTGSTRSEIFGHPQVAMELVPTPKNSIPKMLTTTGTISKKNYGGSPTAKKAEFHHSISALLVEVKGNRFWCRRLAWDGNGVQDLHHYYNQSGRQKTKRPIAAAVYGDVHVDVMTKRERAQLLSLIDGLGAKKNVLHDVLDMHSGSHHTEGQPLHYLHAKSKDIRKELDATLAFMRLVPNAVVVQSNHHDHLDKWFNRYNPSRPDANLNLYYELGQLARTRRDSLFRLYAESKGVRCEWTNPNEEYDVGGVDLSQHGHLGPNGARGSAKAFARTGRKTIIGHSHTPREEKGCMQVGTSSMDHEYANGYSSWLVAHALVYPSGKRTLIYSIDGELSPMVKDALKSRAEHEL